MLFFLIIQFFVVSKRALNTFYVGADKKKRFNKKTHKKRG